MQSVIFKSIFKRCYLFVAGVLVFFTLLMWVTPDASRAARDGVSTTTVSGDRSADGVWQAVPVDQNLVDGAGDSSMPRAYRQVKLDQTLLGNILHKAPREFSANALTDKVVLTLPMPDGSFKRFRIQDSPIMEEALAARYPGIKTYNGQGIDEPDSTTRFDLTPQGFHAIVLSKKGTTLVLPIAEGDTSNYMVFSQKDMPVDTFACGHDETGVDSSETPELSTGKLPQPAALSGATLRTYRLAVAATGDYTQRYGGGTVAGGLAAVTTTMNLVNSIYEREVAVRMVLIANNDTIIFTDPVTDGYTSDNVGALISENQAKLTAVIGSANFDIGHVFDGRSAPGGGFSFQGQASISSVCNINTKARGVSITRSVPPAGAIAFYSTSHEIGHQFGATHTFNANTGNCAGQRTGSTAYEPGTGSTIMGYRFTCGDQDLMSGDTYFHIASLQQINTFISGGGSCGISSSTGNNSPTVSAGPDYTIPRSTPFVLTASASDPDGDLVLYAWEQFDLGAPAPPNTDDGSRPIFRSYNPTSEHFRVFPQMPNVITGIEGLGESLPVTTRTMNFRVTARDNRAGGGGVDFDAMQVNVRADVGPFIVTQPAQSVVWTTNSSRTVTWDVAGTNVAPVNCTTVRITMSMGAGSPTIVLANSTPNDGSETVTIPGVASQYAYIQVEAVDNIFLNVSRDFDITGSHNPQPTISNISPAGAAPGSTVTITGTNLIAPQFVQFNGVNANFTVKSTTEIVVTIPGGATTGQVSILTPYGFVSSDYTVGANAVGFSSITQTVSEGAGSAPIVVTRSSGVGIASVDYSTSDSAGLNECNVNNGVGSSRCDYATSIGTLRFAEGETSKTIFVPLVDDGYGEGNETFTVTLSNPVGMSLASPSSATITIQDNEATNVANPIDGVDFFIRQQYIDFLGREPDPAGLAGWRNVLNNCGTTVQPPCDRIEVSAGFFRSEEFQSRGYFVYRFYSAVGRIPLSNEFFPDFAKLSGFLSADQLEASKAAFVNEFMARAEFQNKYAGTFNNPTTYVDALLQTVGLPSHPSRTGWIALLNGGNTSQNRATVLRQLVESSEVYNKYYNEAFVIMQYFGYLRRTADASYLNWIQTMNSTNGDYRIMINGFMNSSEYRRRFGP